MKDAEKFIPGPMGGSSLAITTSAAKKASPTQLSELRAELRARRPTRSRWHRARKRRRLSLGLRRLSTRPEAS